ncbi:hypothetical protein B566_EDAN017327 [Ephemera danica]|nr:hypothetical protein B566_EDAN017327 [Ephemera danica]
MRIRLITGEATATDMPYIMVKCAVNEVDTGSTYFGDKTTDANVVQALGRTWYSNMRSLGYGVMPLKSSMQQRSNHAGLLRRHDSMLNVVSPSPHGAYSRGFYVVHEPPCWVLNRLEEMGYVASSPVMYAGDLVWTAHRPLQFNWDKKNKGRY